MAQDDFPRGLSVVLTAAAHALHMASHELGARLGSFTWQSRVQVDQRRRGSSQSCHKSLLPYSASHRQSQGQGQGNSSAPVEREAVVSS